MEEVKDLTVVDIVSNPVALFTEGDVDDFLKKAREEAVKEVFDVTTAKGRKGIASQANNVAKLKRSLDGAGKNLVSGWKSQAKAVDVERKKIRDELDALKIDIRKPLTEWEAEQDRIREEKAVKIQSINTLLNCDTECSSDVQSRIDSLSNIESEEGEIADLIERVGEQLQAKKIIAVDFEKRAEDARIAEEERLEKERVEKEKKEAEQKRIEEEKAEKERIEREKQIAEDARIEAEKKAESDRIEYERQQQERINDAKKAAESARLESERIRIEGEEQEKARIAQIEANKIEAQKEQEKAVQAEKDRQQEEQTRLKNEQLARDADLEHRKAVNNKALSDIMVTGITEDQAKAVLKLIVSGLVSNTKLTY